MNTNNDKKKKGNKLRIENAELKRQIKFLGEICRRCNTGGSTNMNGLYQSGMVTKQTICKTCDITYCQYSGMTNEELERQRYTGSSNTPISPELMMNVNPMQGPFGGFGDPNGFTPF